MNEDYLWDKSGDVDRQIQELEETLGRLRYQPRPLKLDGLSPARRRNYGVLLAIAASVAVAFVAGGLWLLSRQDAASIPTVAIKMPPLTTPTINPRLPVFPEPRAKHKLTLSAKHNNQQAVAAKQQLMFALRLASEKLNDAYRRTQSPAQIKNQHKAG